VAATFTAEFGMSAAQAATLAELSRPTGWEPFSTAALALFMPHLQAGARFGALNPTVIRTQNELREVVNNLIGLHGKLDMIRVELAREVEASKREREEMQDGMRK
jgi:CRISPR-associated endonuclease Csn1